MREKQKIVDHKMRDEKYMQHLRAVQKINNRETDHINKDVKDVDSMTNSHRKYKNVARQWSRLEEERLRLEKNEQIFNKIDRIKSYFTFSTQNKINKSIESGNVEEKQIQGDQKQKKSIKQPVKYSFHYRYRKRVQEQINYQNSKLAEGIMTQRSTILPEINKYRKRSVSVLMNKLQDRDSNQNKQKILL